MDLELEGSRAFLLASSKGLGRASAEALVEEGARVVLSSRSEANLDAARTEILAETGAPAEAVSTTVCDLSTPSTVTDRVGDGIDTLGGLDVLVTNSAGPPKIGFEEATLEQFDDTYRLVLRSVITAIDAALPALKDGGGAITNIIAASTQEPEANHVLANTIRPGIYGLAKSLAREYAADGIRVNCVCPKKVGPLTRRERDRTTHIDRYAAERGLSYEAAREEYISEIIPLGRPGTLETFGKAVAYLSSDAANHVTGHSLALDGGWSRSLF